MERSRRTKKKKALSGGLQACEKLLGELFSKKHSQYAFVFYTPVDVKNLPDYNDKIKKPMDMTTIKKKLQDREYSTIQEFKTDLLQIIENCRTYNEEGDEIMNMASKFETVVLKRMAEIETCFFEMPVGDTSTQDMVVPRAAAATAPPQKVNSTAAGGDVAAIDAKIRRLGDQYRKLIMEEAPKPEIEALLNVIQAAKVEFKDATGLDWKPAKPAEGSGDEMSEKVAAKSDKVKLKSNEAPAGGKAQTPKEKGKQEPKEKDGVKGSHVPAPIAKKNTGGKGALKAKNNTKSRASEDKGQGKKVENEAKSSAQDSGDVVKADSSSTSFTEITIPLPESSLEKKEATAVISTKLDGKSSTESSAQDSNEHDGGSKIADSSTLSTKIPEEYAPLLKSSKNKKSTTGGKRMLELPTDEELSSDEESPSKKPRLLKEVKEKGIKNANDLASKAKRAKDVANSSVHLIKDSDSCADDNNWVIVKNVTEECNEELLKLKFITYGKILQFQIDRENESATIQYENQKSVKKVLRAKSIKFFNKQVSVEKKEMPTTRDMDIDNKESDEISAELRRVYNIDKLKVVLSDDQSRPIDERLMDALESIDFDLAECCTYQEYSYLVYSRETMACDSPIMVAGLNAAVGYKMKGAEVVVGEGNGHICLVNRWEMGLGCKGTNKSGGFNKVMQVLLQMENEDIAAKKAQFQKEKEAEALRQDMIEFEFMGLNEDFVDSEAQTSLDTTPQKAANEAEKTPKKSSKRASKKASGSSSIGSVDEDFVDSEAQTSPDTTPQKTANEAEKIPKKSSKGASKKASGSTSIGSVEKENKSKKPSYFLEQLYRNIMQGGTAPGLLATMYHAKEKDFFLNFDEASMFFDLLFTSGGGIQGAKRTEFCTYLLSFFTSRESRSMKVSTGPLVVQDASLQIFGACQPQIIIDAFLKDPRDPAGLFDRFSYCYNRRVNIPLRKQKQNVDNLERVNLDIKKLLRTVESLHAPVISEDVTLTHHQWFFDEDALELVFQFDELLSLHDNGDPTLMAMNAKGRMKMYSGAAINACKRQALEMIMLEGDSESLSKMDQRKIITKEDVLKAIYLTFQSNFIFLQLNATTVDPGSRPLKQKQKSGGLSGGVGRNKPGGKGGAFVVDLEDYERDITDVSKAYEKVYKIYKVAEKVDDDANDQAISFDALLDERAFIRAPSNSNFSEKECLVFFLRFLEYNGIGRLLMNGTIDAKDRTTFSNKEYCNMTFVLHKEDKLNDEAKQFLNRMVVVMRKKDPQFSPFADK